MLKGRSILPVRKMKRLGGFLLVCALFWVQELPAVSALPRMVCGGVTVFGVEPIPKTTFGQGQATAICNSLPGVQPLSNDLFGVPGPAQHCLGTFVFSRMLAWNAVGIGYGHFSVSFWLGECADEAKGCAAISVADDGGLGPSITFEPAAMLDDVLKNFRYPVCQIALEQTTCAGVTVIVAPILGVLPTQSIVNTDNYHKAHLTCKEAGADLPSSRKFFRNDGDSQCLGDFAARAFFFGLLTPSKPDAVGFSVWLGACTNGYCNRMAIYRPGLSNMTRYYMKRYNTKPTSKVYMPAVICQISQKCSGFMLTVGGEDYLQVPGGYSWYQAGAICRQFPNSTLPPKQVFYVASSEQQCLVEFVQRQMARWYVDAPDRIVRIWLEVPAGTSAGYQLKVPGKGNATAIYSFDLYSFTDFAVVVCQQPA